MLPKRFKFLFAFRTAADAILVATPVVLPAVADAALHAVTLVVAAVVAVVVFSAASDFSVDADAVAKSRNEIEMIKRRCSIWTPLFLCASRKFPGIVSFWAPQFRGARRLARDVGPVTTWPRDRGL